MLGRLVAVFLDTRHGERNGLPSFSHCPPGIQLGNRQSSTGWWFFYPSEKYDFVNWDDDIPNIWENKKWQPNHQPVHVELIFPLGIPFSSWISQPCLMTPEASCPNEKFHSQIPVDGSHPIETHSTNLNKIMENHTKSLIYTHDMSLKKTTCHFCEVSKSPPTHASSADPSRPDSSRVLWVLGEWNLLW